MRFPFAVKLAVALCALAVFCTGASVYWIFNRTRSIVIEQITGRLKDIGRAGSYLFDQQLREDVKYLTSQVKEHARFSESEEQLAALYGEDGEPGTEDDGTLETIPAEISAPIMEGEAFQNVVQAMRQIREGSRNTVRPIQIIPALDVIRKTSEDLPTLEYIYLLSPIPDYSTDQYIIYLADSDYLPVEDDGTGEPYEGNPIGNLTLPLTKEMADSFNGEVISEQEFSRDQWGDVVISAYVPILDQDGSLIAAIGMDYNVQSEANDLDLLWRVCVSSVIVAFLLAVFVAILISRRLNKPIAALQVGAQQVSDRKFNVHVQVNSKDEFGDLANAFNSMVTEIKSYAGHLEKLNQAFERFVPHEFFQHMGLRNILDVRLGDQAEREMTVLFSDIRSFSTLSEKMSPTENFKFLNSYLSRVSPIIRSHHGFIDKFIGDSIMALFPRRPDDAVTNAIQMLAQVEDYNRWRIQNKQVPIKIGVGLHTGRLMLGTIGEEHRMESTVISDAVNLASRLEGLTKRFGVNIIASDISVSKIEANGFHERYLGNVHVKGKQTSVHIKEIFNADSEDQIELKKSTRVQFEQAVQLFQKAHLIAALEAFEELLRINPKDSAARVYANQCRRLS